MSASAPRDPEELEATARPVEGEISPGTTLGEVHLSVADVERSVDYYSTAIGLDVIERAAGRATLGAGSTPLLVLVEEPDARPADGYTGLYHFALLVPERTDLARWLAHAAADRVALTGLSDHFVSEALYLRDPDGHGIEIYWTSARGLGRPGRRPYDHAPAQRRGPDGHVDETSGPYEGLAAGTVMGHVHLRVADVDETVAFYRDVLGFGLMAQLGSPGGVPGRWRLSPPHRREHVGEPWCGPRAARQRHAAPRNHPGA